MAICLTRMGLRPWPTKRVAACVIFSSVTIVNTEALTARPLTGSAPLLKTVTTV